MLIKKHKAVSSQTILKLSLLQGVTFRKTMILIFNDVLTINLKLVIALLINLSKLSKDAHYIITCTILIPFIISDKN